MASKEQRELMQDFYDHTGFEFMEMDDVRANDHAGFTEKWEMNCSWLEDLVTETRGMIHDYRNKHYDEI